METKAACTYRGHGFPSPDIGTYDLTTARSLLGARKQDILIHLSAGKFRTLGLIGHGYQSEVFSLKSSLLKSDIQSSGGRQ